MDRQMKGEYFKMKNHGLRRIFSLFLALFMVFTLLPTTALAEDTTGADETQPKTVVVNGDEKKTDPPAQEQPKNENPPAPEEPKTFTVTYTDGADGAVFPNQVYRDLSSGTPTPAFDGTLAREGYTFAGWNPTVAGTVTADVTYAAKWEEGKTGPRRVTVPTIPGPDVDPAAWDTGHKIDVRFTVLYVGDEFNIGYNYGSSEKTKFVCQYKMNHSNTAYNNHTIAISDIKAAAGRASVNSGYQIVGWSKESNANPTTWSLNKSGTTACNKGSTIYLVAKNPNPTTKYTYTLNYDANGGTGAPSADSWSTTDAAIRYHSFTVKNTIPTREGYVFKGWKANDGSDTIYTGGMTCAVSQYGNDVVKNGNTWTRTLYAVWEEATPPKPDKPTAPGEGDLSGLIGNITVNCTNGKAAHELKAKGYTLISGSYTTNEVAGDAENGYTYTVTINSQKYVEQFDADTGAAHDPKDASATVTLKHTDNGWAVESGAPVVFNVACVTEIVPPARPGAEDLSNLKAPVEVACTTKPETHNAARFPLIEGTYNIGDVSGNETDGYTCDIIITADEYVTKYNTDFGKHTLTGDNTKPLTLKYVEGRWVVNDPVTFPVECEEELFPVHLVIYRNGDTSKAYKDVALESQPKGHVIDLSTIDIADYYTGNYEFYGWYDDGLFNIYKSDPANPPAGLKEKTVNGWTNLKCMVYDKYQVVYFQSEEAWRDFQNDPSKTEGRLYSTTAPFGSTLPTADAPTPTRTGYTFKFWSREGQNGDVTGQTVNGWTNLYAVWEKNTYTVTYTDGVNGEAFADQAYTAKYEDATPAFEGTPTRAGYKFLGWEPTVAETVTENATYVAQWEKLYTVTYTDGVGEKAFKDDVHSDLEKDTKTPAYKDGIPTRKGFKFLGWEPEVADTVTEDVTYIAKWGELYTVTYTDGAKGKAFEDQVYENVLSGTKTPNFDGTPTRKGYKFAGWEPEVAETVTENVTYTAKWEELYTVTYTDGVKGKAFKDQVYSDLEAGTDTPKFDGKPTRKGYTFTGWSPKVTDTVTKDVTYVAQWKSVKNGKDNIPKTGDGEIVMVLGSVLLFSFCGAAAVSVYDRKRKHF